MAEAVHQAIDRERWCALVMATGGSWAEAVHQGVDREGWRALLIATFFELNDSEETLGKLLQICHGNISIYRLP